MIEVNATSDGHEITLAVNEILALSLPENPTTGFRWDFAIKPEPVCSLVKSAFEPAGGPPGNGGTHLWQFQAMRPGSGQIQLDYRRSWEKETPATRTFRLTIHVR